MQIIFKDPYSSLSPRLPVGEIIGEAVKEHDLVPAEEYDAYISDFVGNIKDENIDIKLMCKKYEIPYDFSKEALEEASKVKDKVDIEELSNRIDLRNENIFTIILMRLISY